MLWMKLAAVAVQSRLNTCRFRTSVNYINYIDSVASSNIALSQYMCLTAYSLLVTVVSAAQINFFYHFC